MAVKRDKKTKGGKVAGAKATKNVKKEISSERERHLRQTAARRQERKKKSHALVYAVVLVFAVAAGLMATVKIFFNVEKIVVTGNTVYDSEQIIADSGIKPQMNLFSLPSKSAIETIKSKYPYIKDVKIKRNLPTEAEIAITEEEPIGVVKNDGGYTVVAASGKILDKLTLHTSGIPLIKGLDISGMETGDRIDEAGGSSKQFEILKKLTAELKKKGYDNFDVVDMIDAYNINIYYKDKYRIVIGSESELDYKAAGIKKLLEEELIGFVGVINVSNPSNISTRPMTVEDYRTEVQKNADFLAGSDNEPQEEREENFEEETETGEGEPVDEGEGAEEEPTSGEASTEDTEEQ